MLFILKSAYWEFVERVGETAEPRGAKTRMVIDAIGSTSGTFSLAELERTRPGVLRDMIRHVLAAQKGEARGRSGGREGNWLERG